MEDDEQTSEDNLLNLIGLISSTISAIEEYALPNGNFSFPLDYKKKIAEVMRGWLVFAEGKLLLVFPREGSIGFLGSMLWTPHFGLMRFPLDGELDFYLKNDFYWLFEKWLGVATYFCFIFKG